MTVRSSCRYRCRREGWIYVGKVATGLGTVVWSREMRRWGVGDISESSIEDIDFRTWCLYILWYTCKYTCSLHDLHTCRFYQRWNKELGCQREFLASAHLSHRRKVCWCVIQFLQ